MNLKSNGEVHGENQGCQWEASLRHPVNEGRVLGFYVKNFINWVASAPWQILTQSEQAWRRRQKPKLSELQLPRPGRSGKIIFIVKRIFMKPCLNYTLVWAIATYLCRVLGVLDGSLAYGYGHPVEGVWAGYRYTFTFPSTFHLHLLPLAYHNVQPSTYHKYEHGSTSHLMPEERAMAPENIRQIQRNL